MADEYLWVVEEFLDNETGEKSCRKVYFEIRGLSTDAETGEPEIEDLIGPNVQIPARYSRSHQENQRKNESRRETKCQRFFRKRNIVEEVIVGSKKNVGPIAFILPTFFICPGWASIVCLLGEACMHIWSHKRNRNTKNNNVEYRSPLHCISSQFCIHCRSQKWMEKISNIQDKRTLRRKIIFPNFMRQIVR